MQKSTEKNIPETESATTDPTSSSSSPDSSSEPNTIVQPKEVGGRKGPEPTRYGDWEKNGRCIDF